MRGHGAKFTRKMGVAVIAILTQRNLQEAAHAAGIGIATLMRWQKVPEFQEALRSSRRCLLPSAGSAARKANRAAA